MRTRQPSGRAYADMVAERNNWTWRRPDTLAPGEVQVFAGRRMTVRTVDNLGSYVKVTYTDAPERVWNVGTEVGVANS